MAVGRRQRRSGNESNPVSNAIYQRIGFEPISDVVALAFSPATVDG